MDHVDFGKTAADYAQHRRGFPERFFEALSERELVKSGTRALDIGSGTGAVARGLARLGAKVTALDSSPELLAEAQRLAGDEGLALETCVASAEASGLADGSFELVCAGQCWHWFEPRAAARELARLLAPEGRVVLAAFDWLPIIGSAVAATEVLIEEHNPAWTMGGGDGRHPEWRRDLEAGGFQIIEEHFELVPTSYTPEAWRGRIRASAGVGATLSPEAIAEFDAAHAQLLDARFPGESLDVPHSLAFCVAGR
jgi:SAM-dependent methyltransferase